MTRVAASSLVAGLALAAVASAAQADDQYCARLGENDHFSSKGARLNTVGAVIQQDRANFHRFGQRDPEDETDPVFGDKANRDTLNNRVDANALSVAERREIIDGTPYVCVTISEDGSAYITSIR